MTASEQHTAADQHTFEAQRNPWKLAVLASMADYIDGGSIVAISASLAIWKTNLGLGAGFIGLVAALGPNALAGGIGAIVGGRLGDALGRKRVYQFDLLLYAFGTLWLIFAFNSPMIIVGSVLVGLAVGIDVPTSWALLGEASPRKSRSRLMGLTNLLWNLGPVVVLLIALAVANLGMLGTRIIFAQLFVIAVITYLLRRGIAESVRWKDQAADGSNPLSFKRIRDLAGRASRKGLAFTAPVFFFWNLAAATNGIFTPYILSTVGGQSQGASVALSALGFFLGIVAVGTVFMPLADSARRRTIFAIGGGLQVVAFLLFFLLPLTTPVALANVILFGFGGGFAQFPFIRVWFSELFPTSVRATAQGLVYGGVRVLLFFWSLAVPVIATVGVKPLGLMLAIFLFISAAVGVIFMPNTAGKTLEQIQEEQASA